MFKLATFRSDAAFWPLPDSGEPSRTGRPSSLFWTVLTAPARLGAALLAEIRARSAMQTLADLDERMLRDIGVERDQIAHACRYGRDALLRPDLSRWA
jgi:uncharacterized protein YjiS (DUF1127 family)